MPKFSAGGREFVVELNVTALKRVRALVGVDLMDALDGSLIQKMRKDPALLVDVLWAIVKPDAGSMTDEDFGRSMGGDVLGEATTALLEAIVSFCPSPRDRALLEKVLKAAETAEGKVRDVIEARVAALDPSAIADAVLAAETPGNSSPSVRESSD